MIANSRKVILNSKLKSLIGFATKARGLENGFEGVRRALAKGKLAVILVDDSLAKDSLRRILKLSRQSRTPLLQVAGDEAGESLFAHCGYKILGVRRGPIAGGFLEFLL